MASRVLRSRKSTSTEPTAAVTNSSPSKPPVLSVQRQISRPTRSNSKSEVNDENDEDYPALPLFGLSELAMSGVQSEDEEDEEEEIDEDQGHGHGQGPPKKKRVRNPPRHPVICPTCGKNFTRKAHLVRHMYLHTGEKPFKCNQCDLSFNRKDHLRSHLRGHAAESKEFPCNHCHLSFRRPDLLRVHTLKSHGKYQKNFRPGTVVKSSTMEAGGSQQSGSKSFGFKILTCHHCNKRFTQEHLYNAHLASHENEDDENQDDNGEREMADGAFSAEGVDAENSEYDVDDMEVAEFGEQGGEEYEDLLQGEEEDYDNSNVEKSATHEQIQEILERQLNQPRKFECVVCAKIFKEQRSLRRHYKLHKRNFVCRFCGIKMSSAGSLMRHNLLHTGEKPFHCELCDRRFSRKDALKAHLAAHEKESTKVQLSRPYKCTICNARYTMRYNLIRHLRQSHPGQRNNAARHLPIPQRQVVEADVGVAEGDAEGGENSLQCKHCGKVFANMKSLSTHVWYHNQEKRFVCKICNHGFKYQTDLNRHFLTHKTGRNPKNMTQLLAQNRLAQAKQSAQYVQIQNQKAQPTHNSIVVNGQRLYPCGVCGQIFNHRSNRSRHCRLFHKGTQAQPAPPQRVQMQQQRRPVPAMNKIVQQRPPPMRQPIDSQQRISVELAAQLVEQAQRQARISIDNDDEQPNYNGIWKCEQCDKTFTKRYNYKLHMRTHNKQFACLVCGLRTASQGDLTLHIRTHTGEKPFKCSRCEWRFCRRSALTVHFRRHHGPNAKIRRHYNPQRVTPNMMQVDDDVADQLMPTSPEDIKPDGSILKTMLQNNAAAEEEDVKPRIPKKNLPPPPPLIRYPIATSHQTLRNALTVHKVEVSGNGEQTERSADSDEVVFLCRPCGTLITGKEDYVAHMLQEHGTSVSVTAPGQSQQRKPGASGPPSLQQRPKLLKRPQEQEQQLATSCRQCGELLGSKHDVTVHNLVAHSVPNSPVTCGICRSNCSNITFLSRHYQIMHPDVENAAEEARILMLNTTSSTQEDDSEYLDNTQEDADAANLLCPEVVLQEEEAGEGHEDGENGTEYYDGDYPAAETVYQDEIAENEQQPPIDPNLPYPCPLCNKAFKDKKALADHKWYHSREPIHSCTICGKKFKLKNDLIRHHRRHLQERPYGCPQEGCESRFYQKMDLDRHLVKVHNQVGNMPYPCGYCPARFAQPATLVRHMRSSHPNKDVSQALVMHAQKKKAEEAQMQEYLSNLPPEDEEQQEQNYEYEDGTQADQNDYSLELEQLEIDMSTEDENHGYLNQEENVEQGTEEGGDDGMVGVSQELDIEEAEGVQYENDEAQDWQYAEGEEMNLPIPGTSSSLLQPCMKKLEEYTNAKGELYCKPCNKHFKDLKTLQNHVYYHQREPKHPCDTCGARFKQKSDLRRHLTIHYDPEKSRHSISCPNCNRSFTDERYLRIHLNRNCEGIPEEGAGEEYQEYEEVQEEDDSMNVAEVEYEDGNEGLQYGEAEADQEGQEAWGEETDPMMFVASDLQTEAMDHEDNGAYEEYDEGQYEEGDMQYEQVTYECEICGATFLRSNELILHKRSHAAKTTKTFPFTSTSASSSSANKKTKIFSCDKCGVSFIQKAELTQHLQTYHLDELPVHQCQFCPKYFYVKKSLDTHRRRHHSHLMNLHPCKVCGAKFSQLEYLMTHMKSHHQNVKI